MEIAALKKKYGGVLRYVFVKHLHKRGGRMGSGAIHSDARYKSSAKTA